MKHLEDVNYDFSAGSEYKLLFISDSDYHVFSFVLMKN